MEEKDIWKKLTWNKEQLMKERQDFVDSNVNMQRI